MAGTNEDNVYKCCNKQVKAVFCVSCKEVYHISCIEKPKDAEILTENIKRCKLDNVNLTLKNMEKVLIAENKLLKDTIKDKVTIIRDKESIIAGLEHRLRYYESQIDRKVAVKRKSIVNYETKLAFDSVPSTTGVSSYVLPFKDNLKMMKVISAEDIPVKAEAAENISKKIEPMENLLVKDEPGDDPSIGIENAVNIPVDKFLVQVRSTDEEDDIPYYERATPHRTPDRSFYGIHQNQQIGPGRERQTIWQGLLEWIEKPKNPNDSVKVTKHVPCQVSANAKDGEPELKAEGWPPKLIMQLMPKQLIGNIGGAYLKNSKSVLFHPQNCEALESLTKVMSSGFAGCVHFTSSANTSACDIKVLILLYTAEKRAYLGFIPNDQVAFVDRLRKVIQQQKSMQMPRPVQGTGPNMNPQTGGPVTMPGAAPQMPGTNTPTSQTTQQGLMISQTNTMAMGGGQITQNVVTSTGQPGTGIGGVLGQAVQGGAMPPRLRMQGMPQTGAQLNQPTGTNAANMSGGMLGAPVQRAPFENQLQVERQQNLEKIVQLKQTLEAAQQQEQQYKNQLERISHMKTSQLQEALQIAQQTEMQYKILDQQRMANQGNPQAANVQQQQRMMRPVMSNNPGLRHLLQQQPQYRQQLMGMQPMGNGPRPQMGQQMQNAGNNPQGPFDETAPFDFMV